MVGLSNDALPRFISSVFYTPFSDDAPKHAIHFPRPLLQCTLPIPAAIALDILGRKHKAYRAQRPPKPNFRYPQAKPIGSKDLGSLADWHRMRHLTEIRLLFLGQLLLQGSHLEHSQDLADLPQERIPAPT